MCDFGISGYLVDSVAKTMDAGCKPYMAVSGGIPARWRGQDKILPLCSGLDFSSCTSSLRDPATIYLYSMIPVWMNLCSPVLGRQGSLRLVVWWEGRGWFWLLLACIMQAGEPTGTLCCSRREKV